MVETTDKRIAAVLQTARQDVMAGLSAALCLNRSEESDETDLEQILWVLAKAFRHGRWGSFYCLFSQPSEAARCLNHLAVTLAPHLLREPDAEDLVGRLLQIVGEMALVATEAERASAERSVEELKDLSEIKSAFLRLTTHELRRPLGLTRGHVALLEDGTYGQVPDSFRQPLRQIAAGADEMAALVDGLAAVSKLEDRAEVLRRKRCEVGMLTADAISGVEAEAGAKNINIQLDAPTADLQVMADPERMRIALLNLVANAVKYAPPDTEVSVRAWGSRNEVAIAVADQGPGVDPGERDQIFEMHYRSTQLPDSCPGLGLGLYIVRQIVELHGGRVTLQSSPGKGSTFTIILPRHPTASAH